MTVISSYLHNFSIISISHWKRTWPFTWKNESPSSKYTLSQFTWKWLSGFGDFFLKFALYDCYFLLSLLPKRATWPGCFVPSLIGIGQVVLENMKMCQVFRQMYGRTDWRQEKLTWAFISGKLIRSPRATSFTWETIPINLHIFAKLWLYHNVD